MDGVTSLSQSMGTQDQSLTSTQQGQGITQDVGPSQFMFANYGHQIVNTQLLIEYQPIGSYFILGSATNGILGTSTLGSNMVWGNGGTFWGTAVWGGTISSFSTLYSNTTTQSITTAAKNAIASWLAGGSLVYPSSLALGTGTNPYTLADTSLQIEFYRTTFDAYNTSTDKVLNASRTFNSTESSVQGQNITEFGVLNDATTGTLFSRYVMPAMQFYATGNYKVTIQTTVNDASSFNSISPTSGLNSMRNWFAGVSINPPNYMAWGTGTTALDPTDTILEGEVQRNLLSSRSSNQNTVIDNGLLTYSQGVNSRIIKSGLYDTVTLGTLWFEQYNTAGPLKYNTFQIDETDQITII